MDNDPMPDFHVLFIDNVKIKYVSSTGLATIFPTKRRGNEARILSFQFNEQDILLKHTSSSASDKNQKIKQYSSYIKFARDAVDKCLSIEHLYTTRQSYQVDSMVTGSKKTLMNFFPICFKIIANGKSCSEWIDVTLYDESSDERNTKTVDVPNKSYLIDETAFSLSSIHISSGPICTATSDA